MNVLNRITGGVIDGLLWPFRGLPPAVGLAFVSLLTAIGVLLLYRKVSDQAGISAVRRAIIAAILEMRLFRDDLVIVFRAQGRVLRHALRYSRYSLVPLAWMIVPLILLIAQLQHVYGYRALAPGESAIVRVKWAGTPTEAPDIRLETAGLRLATSMLRIPALRETEWRITALDPGRQTITVRAGDASITKIVRVGAGSVTGRISPVRPSRNILAQLVRPVEPPVPADTPVRSITVQYDDATVSVFGWQWNWVVAFLVFTILFGFALQKPLGVKL